MASAATFVVVALPALLVLFLAVRAIDPPWQVSESGGTVLNAGVGNAVRIDLNYYKSTLLVRLDDGRTVGVASPREAAAKW